MPRGCTRRPVTGHLPLCVAPSSPASPSLASEGEPRGHHPLRAWVPSSQAALSDPAGVGVCAALQTAALFLPTEPYTCGACGIQFQFYNNLLEHMQSHAGKDPAAGAGRMLQPPPIPFPRILQEAGPAWEPRSVCCHPGSVELKKPSVWRLWLLPGAWRPHRS